MSFHPPGSDQPWSPQDSPSPPRDRAGGASFRPLRAPRGWGPFKCPKCDKSYSSKGSLSRHLKVECGKRARVPCPYCDALFKHKSSVVTHIVRKHPF